MYLKLLEEAVLTEQGQPLPRKTECTADLTVAANIPDRYVPRADQRMDLYRRIAAIRSEEDADDLVDELIDRYGDPPRTVNNLITVALLRSVAAECGITEISQKGERLFFYLNQVDVDRMGSLCSLPAYGGRVTVEAGSDRPALVLRLKKGEEALNAGRKLVEAYFAAGASS